MVMQSVQTNVLLALLTSLPIGVGSQRGGPSSSNGCCTFPGAYTQKCTSLTLPAMGTEAAEGDCAWTTTSPLRQRTEYPNAPSEPLNPHCGYEANCSDIADCNGHWCSFAPTAAPTENPTKNPTSPTSSPSSTPTASPATPSSLVFVRMTHGGTLADLSAAQRALYKAQAVVLVANAYKVADVNSGLVIKSTTTKVNLEAGSIVTTVVLLDGSAGSIAKLESVAADARSIQAVIANELANNPTSLSTDMGHLPPHTHANTHHAHATTADPLPPYSV